MLYCINEEETCLCKSLCANLLIDSFFIGKNCPNIGSCYLDFHLGRVVERHIILITKDLSQQCKEAQGSWCWLTGSLWNVENMGISLVEARLSATYVLILSWLFKDSFSGNNRGHIYLCLYKWTQCIIGKKRLFLKIAIHHSMFSEVSCKDVWSDSAWQQSSSISTVPSWLRSPGQAQDCKVVQS